MPHYRVVYAGCDFFSSCLDLLVGRDDVEVVTCLTGAAEAATRHVTALCAAAEIPMLRGRPDAATVQRIRASEVDLLLCAAYPFRVPVEQLGIPLAVNMHPTLLPHGRGPSPLPYLIAEAREDCGLSLHEMTPDFDDGPLILQRPIELEDGDGVDELTLKMFASAPMLLADFLGDVDGAYAARVPQEGGSYWPAKSIFERTLDARRMTVEEARGAQRLYGTSGVVIRLDGHPTVRTRSLSAARCGHDFTPGRLLAEMDGGSIVALADGLMWVRPDPT